MTAWVQLQVALFGQITGFGVIQVELSASAISVIIPLSSTDTDKFHVYTDKSNSIKKILQIIIFHLTRLFELRKSCWEICDSQRV